METSVERDLYNDLNQAYEDAYRDNPLKKACVQRAITHLKHGDRILDVGCGTGVPVAQMLAEAGMEVHGIDLAEEMTRIARKTIPGGTFNTITMQNFKFTSKFKAVFIIYSQLGLKYRELHDFVTRAVEALEDEGLLVMAQSPCDDRVPEDDPTWDSTHSYVEGFNLPFFGKPFYSLMFPRDAQVQFLRSMGLEVLYNEAAEFQPSNPICNSEVQQYVIARRPANVQFGRPQPLPT